MYQLIRLCANGNRELVMLSDDPALLVEYATRYPRNRRTTKKSQLIIEPVN